MLGGDWCLEVVGVGGGRGGLLYISPRVVVSVGWWEGEFLPPHIWLPININNRELRMHLAN